MPSDIYGRRVSEDARVRRHPRQRSEGTGTARESEWLPQQPPLPAYLPAKPSLPPIDWQTWPAIGGLPPGPATSPVPSGGQLLRPAGSPLAPAGGYSAKVGGGGGSRTPPYPPRVFPRQTRSLGSETETPCPSRWSYHGGPRHRVGRQTQSLPTPRRRRGPVRQTRFLEPSPRSTSASGKPRPGRQGSVAPSERASARVRAAAA